MKTFIRQLRSYFSTYEDLSAGYGFEFLEETDMIEVKNRILLL